ncbi:Phospholipid methyltransferase [Penicillium malachiteum]|uniref:Phospholipid methyltransferase n=1 Tax=Penicillium malachiteum TaxID=1324776 RepID=UPI00254854B3|nr:Phospholipid methyltransferase [Penicillium malachiteum]KAJ5720583.1 Phospholipid methyltransferase [Penicillium malachiteum]
MVVAGYLAAVCCTPPNPSLERKRMHKVDRIAPFSGIFPYIFRGVLVLLVIYQALLIVVPGYFPDITAQICPQLESVNPALLSWSKTSIIAITLMLVGAPVRLSAYGGLGRNFTFNLAAPDQLVTSGIYRWIQHPGYAGQNAILVGCMLLFMRWDAAPACWIGESSTGMTGWGYTVWVSILGICLLLLSARVRDEENMLKEKFGKQWEDWHRSTKRFIPGLF